MKSKLKISQILSHPKLELSINILTSLHNYKKNLPQFVLFMFERKGIQC